MHIEYAQSRDQLQDGVYVQIHVSPEYEPSHLYNQTDIRLRGLSRLTTYEPPDEWLPTFLCDHHMFGIARLEDDRAALVKGPQANPVLAVKRLHAHRHNGLLQRVLIILRNSIRAEPAALLRHDSLVLREQHQNQLIQAPQVRLQRRIALLRALVVDGGEKAARGEVVLEARGIAEVLRLHELALREVGVGPTQGGAPCERADDVERATERDIGDAHVLRAEGDEVVHGRGIVPLDVGAEELAACVCKGQVFCPYMLMDAADGYECVGAEEHGLTLGEPDRVEPARQLCDIRQLCGDVLDLVVHVSILSPHASVEAIFSIA